MIKDKEENELRKEHRKRGGVLFLLFILFYV